MAYKSRYTTESYRLVDSPEKATKFSIESEPNLRCNIAHETLTPLDQVITHLYQWPYGFCYKIMRSTGVYYIKLKDDCD